MRSEQRRRATYGHLEMTTGMYAVASVAVGAALCFSPLVATGIVLVVLSSLVFIRIPVLAPATLVASNMSDYPLASIGENSIGLSDAVLVTSLPVLLRFIHASRIRRAGAALAPPMAALVTAAGLSSVYALDRLQSVIGTLQLVEYLVAFFLAVATVRDGEQLVLFLRLLLYAIIANALLALGQLVGLVPIDTIAFDTATNAVRVTGISGNALGRWIVLGILISVWLYSDLRRLLSWRRLTVVMAVLTAALLATGIRTALLSVMVALFVTFVLSRIGVARLRSGPAAGSLGVAIAAALGIVMFRPDLLTGSIYGARLAQFASPLASQTGSTSYTRIQMWKTARAIFEENPILGVGLNNWDRVKYRYGLPKEIAGLDTAGLNDPHHRILELLAEGGLALTVSFLLFLVLAARLGTEKRSSTHAMAPARPLEGLAVLMFISTMAAQLTGGEVGSQLALFTIIGAAVGAAMSRESERSDPHSEENRHDPSPLPR